MSGPITVLVCPAAALPVLLAASAIRAARAVQQARAQAAEVREKHEQDRTANRQRQAVAHSQGLAALQARAEAAEQRIAQLAEMSERLGNAQALRMAQPQRPEIEDYTALAEYVRAVEAFTQDAQDMLLTATASQPSSEGNFGALSLPLAMSAPMELTRPSQRLLQRIAHLGMVPAGIQSLADELDGATDAVRSELLASELRRRIQLYAETALQEEVLRAQALVVEQSLQDLGYQVEEIESTLFVEGGVAHFRKSHWGDYMVRMRVEEGGGSLNFNVVRAVDDHNTAEPGVQDHLAEDRWCAEFPALLKALAARGVHLEVTRRLEAGELPVQRVVRDRLPRFADSEAPRSVPAQQPMALNPKSVDHL